MVQRTAGVPSDGGMPAAADGETEEVGTHCNHQALQTMKLTKSGSFPGKSQQKKLHLCSC